MFTNCQTSVTSYWLTSVLDFICKLEASVRAVNVGGISLPCWRHVSRYMLVRTLVFSWACCSRFLNTP